MKIEYIQSGEDYYFSQIPCVQDPQLRNGVCLPEVKIKKLWFGKYRVDIFPRAFLAENGFAKIPKDPEITIILYPSGIKKIKYIND